MRLGRRIVFLSLPIVLAGMVRADAVPTRVEVSENTARFETAGGMLLTAELTRSGPGLVREMFHRGYSTSEAIRQVTGEEGFGWATGAMRALAYGSGAGVPMARSSRIRRLMSAAGAGTDSVAFGRTRLAEFARVSGLSASPPDDLNPIFLPFAAAEPPSYSRAYRSGVAANPWTRERVEQGIDAGGAGLYGFAATLAAEELLDTTRQVTDNRRQALLLGASDQEGFLGLVLLDAAAALAESAGPTLTATTQGQFVQTDLVSYDPFSEIRYIPHYLRVTLDTPSGTTPASVTQMLIGEAESRLFDQAAWLLFASELYGATGAASTMWRNTSGRLEYGGGRTEIFEARLHQTAGELAAFLLRNLGALHWDPSEGHLTFCSASRGIEPTTRTPVLDARDAGLTLVALANVCQRMQDAPVAGNARTLLDRQADFLIRLQGRNGGFHDLYNTARAEPQSSAQSVWANVAIARGLFAAFAATNTARYREAAERAIAFIEASYNPKAGLYVDQPSGEGAVTSLQAAFTLGLLREAALASGNVRLLHRYREMYLAFRRLGLLIAEEAACDAGSGGSLDADQDGIPRPEGAGGTQGMAPLPRARVRFQVRTE